MVHEGAARESRALFCKRNVPHIVLLGDSIFDNGAYVGGGAEDRAGRLVRPGSDG